DVRPAEADVEWPVARIGLGRLRAPPEVPRLPRLDGRDAGHAGRLAGVRDRVVRLRRRRREHQVDLVAVDQRLRELPRPRRIGLRVLVDDLDGVLLAADRDALRERLAREPEREGIRLPETAERPGP